MLWDTDYSLIMLDIISAPLAVFLPKVTSFCLRSYELARESWSFFTFSMDVARETNVLAAHTASLKLGGKCGVHKQAVASSLLSASQRSPPSASKKVTTVHLTKVTAIRLAKVQYLSLPMYGLSPLQCESNQIQIRFELIRITCTL